MNMNKIEVTFPSADPSCQLSGDLTFPLNDDERQLLPAIVIVAGSGVSYFGWNNIDACDVNIILFYARGSIILLSLLPTHNMLLYIHVQIINSR